MNPIQKQLLGLGAAVMLAMLIFPPWTKITHHVVLELDQSTTQTETQEFAGYSFLFEPPLTRGLAAHQTMLVPGDYYESVEIDYDLFLLQWLTVAFLTGAGLLYFKGSDKKSLQEWWSSVITPAKLGPPSNPPQTTPPDSPMSETQVHYEPVESIKAKADGGDARAQNKLGMLYEKGEGVSQDYIESLKWYRKAADQGDAKAQYNLGRIYNLGQGVSQNYNEGLKWTTKAANQGNAHAQAILGLMYEQGQGVTRDYSEAVKWYRRAAEQGDKSAQKLLDHAEKVLRQAPPISETQVLTNVGSNKASETTPRNQLSPWKRALKPAEAAFGIGVVAGIASATSVHMDVPPSNKLLFDGFMAVVTGLLLAVPTYLVVGLYSAAKGKR
jgi:TPR repeat protein